MMRLNSLLTIISFFIFVSCINNAGEYYLKDNSSDNNTDIIPTFLTLNFGYVPLGKIKEAKVTYDGEETVMVIDNNYRDITMLMNEVAPSFSTTCGSATDTSKVLTLTKNCVLSYAFAPKQEREYKFSIPTNFGNISFNAIATASAEIFPKITFNKINYTLNRVVKGADTIYYDNLTLTQAGGGAINARYLFAGTRADPSIARFIPATDSQIVQLGFPVNQYCSFSPDSGKITGFTNCKVLILFDVTPEHLLPDGKNVLPRGYYTAAIGFLNEFETLGHSATVSVSYP